MKPLLTRKHTLVLIKLFAAGCLTVACVTLTRITEAAFLDYQVKNMTTEQQEQKMKTMCVGRFLIDFPADAEISYAGATIAGWLILPTFDETEDQFAARLQAKKIKLAGEKNEKDMASLEAVKRVDANGVHGQIFVFGRQWVRGMEGEIPTQTIKLEANVRTRTHSYDLAAEINFDSDLKQLEQLVTQIRERAPDEIPKDAGFCFDGGFVTEPIPIEQSERTTMFVGLAGHPDVSFVLYTIAGITTPKSLLQRDDENTIRSQYSSHYHTFRRGPLSIGGNAGEQLLERVSESNGTDGHTFQWEIAHNKPDSVFTPLMALEMSTGNGSSGKPVQSSLTDAEALVLWDKMLSSIRVRPVQKSKSAAAVREPSALGTWVTAGERCPESGWWECTDGDKTIDILGGRAQFYRAGERMAQATQLVPVGLLQSLGAKRKTFTSKIPSPWKLIDRRSQPRAGAEVELAPASPLAPTGIDADAPSASEVEQEMPPIAMGTMGHSGVICPVSGWWMCMESGTLDGTRWFARGQHLPLATVLSQQSMIDKIKGAPSVARRAAPWKLVRRDDGHCAASSDGASSNTVQGDTAT